MKQAGFTLIEVLIALAVAAIALLALTQAGGRYVAVQDGLQTRVQATWLAQNEVMRLHSGLQRTLRSGVEIHYAGRAWIVGTHRQQTAVPGVYQLQVAVRPLEADTPAARLTTVVAP